jgi:hypothetical protein
MSKEKEDIISIILDCERYDGKYKTKKSVIKLDDGVIKFKIINIDTNYFDYEKSKDMSKKIDSRLEKVVPKHRLEIKDNELQRIGFSVQELLHKNIFTKDNLGDLQTVLKGLDCLSFIYKNELVIFHRYYNKFNLTKRVNRKIDSIILSDTIEVVRDKFYDIYKTYLNYSYSYVNQTGKFSFQITEDGITTSFKIETE